ncbi:hypothetical protein LCGC14_3118380 [marine sediment metagenome]|uniref:Uncharacterized protein n=1 Tax=marine sediment metagenome TaxID=412755 RepID=A0A0F8YAG5_9ZZZZ
MDRGTEALDREYRRAGITIYDAPIGPVQRYRWVVQTAAASMPNNCWGRYGRVAVIELDATWPGDQVAMISERARGCRRVIATWENLFHGSSDRCAYWLAYVEAEKMADTHNARYGL